MDARLKILFVPRWYPNRTDPMPGLFIQRLAGALAKKLTVQVVSVHPDPVSKETYEVVHSVENSVKVCRVYYKTGQRLPVVSKLLNFIRYVRAHHHGSMSLMPFSADIVHGHILTREIFFAWYMALKQNCPFIISEHWSRYFPENGTYKGLFRKSFTAFLLKRSAGLITVSESLAKAMQDAGLKHEKTFVIPNVIDVSAFIPSAVKRVGNKAVILHVSCFEDKSKNISGFLDALAELYKKRNDFRVLLVGEGPDYDAMRDYARSRGLNDENVEFTGLKQNSELIRLFQTSSFLVQTSRYETFGTVLIEALACGLPVVSTNTGIAPLIINQSNGILIQQPTVYEIVVATEKMLNIYPNFDPHELHDTVKSTFSEDSISEKMLAVYYEIINTWQKD